MTAAGTPPANPGPTRIAAPSGSTLQVYISAMIAIVAMTPFLHRCGASMPWITGVAFPGALHDEKHSLHNRHRIYTAERLIGAPPLEMAPVGSAMGLGTGGGVP